MISRTTLLVAAGAAAVLIGAGVTASDSFRGSILGLVRGELDPHEDPLHSLPGHKGVYVVDEGMEGRNSVWADPLDEVDWVPAAAASFMRDDDFVIGFRVDRQAYAIAWWHLDNHHVANLEVGGRYLLVNFCEMCSSAVGFSPVIDGRRHRFRLIGKYKGSILVSDYETNTLWAPFSGEALEGELEGRRLERAQLYQGTWKDWRELHPETRVARADESLRKGHGSRQFPGRERIDEGFRQTLTREIDPRLPSNMMIVGVSSGGVDKAYSIAALHRAGSVLNDTLGGRPIAVYAREGSLLSTAFLAEIEGRRLTFEVDHGDLRDVETGTRWSFDGEAIEGPMTGHSLTPVQSQAEEWYIWASYRPDTRVYGTGDAGEAAR